MRVGDVFNSHSDSQSAEFVCFRQRSWDGKAVYSGQRNDCYLRFQGCANSDGSAPFQSGRLFEPLLRMPYVSCVMLPGCSNRNEFSGDRPFMYMALRPTPEGVMVRRIHVRAHSCVTLEGVWCRRQSVSR